MKTNIFTYTKGWVSAAALLVAMIATQRVSAQDQQHFSMYMLQQPIINVGAMGSYDQIYGGAFYNNQLVGFDGSPMIGMIDMGFPIAKTNLILGFNVSQERFGVNNRTSAFVNAAYRIKLNIKNYLAIGVGVGAQFTASNFSQLNNTGPDPLLVNNKNYFRPQARIGAYYFTNNLYVGASVSNLISTAFEQNSERIKVSVNDIHWNLHAGYQVNFCNNTWKFQPSLLLKYSVGAPLQIDVNAHFLYKNMIGVGASYRSLGNLVVIADYTINKKVTIGYSVNFGLQNARSNFYHGHEVYLGFKLNKKGENNIPVDVPRF